MFSRRMHTTFDWWAHFKSLDAFPWLLQNHARSDKHAFRFWSWRSCENQEMPQRHHACLSPEHCQGECFTKASGCFYEQASSWTLQETHASYYNTVFFVFSRVGMFRMRFTNYYIFCWVKTTQAGDIVMGVKQRMHSSCSAQDPVVLVPAKLTDRLVRKYPNQASDRRVPKTQLFKKYRETARSVRDPTFPNMPRAANYLESWLDRSTSGLHRQPRELQGMYIKNSHLESHSVDLQHPPESLKHLVPVEFKPIKLIIKQPSSFSFQI